MDKQDLISHFDNKAGLARFMGVSRTAITQLPEQLSETYQQSVLGRMLRTKHPIPAAWLKPAKS